MQGKIKTFTREKGFGFIKGDDDKDYFFHINSFVHSRPEALGDGSVVSFDPVPTPKGYRAERCKVVELVSMGYEGPGYLEILISKTDTIRGWELIEVSDWFICSMTTKDKLAAEDHIKFRAASVGGNALIDFRCEREIQSEGNYKYSVFTCYGRPAFAARRRVGGTLDVTNRLTINMLAQRLKQQLIDERTKNLRQVKRMWTVLSIGMIALIFVLGYLGYLGFAAAICVALLIYGASFARNRRDTSGWLAKVPKIDAS